MNAFDDNLKNRAGDFRLEPRKEVWERVREELDSKKRKRRLVWIWWFVPMVLAGGGLWLMQNPGEQKNSKIIDNQVITANPKPEISPNKPQGNQILVDENPGGGRSTRRSTGEVVKETPFINSTHTHLGTPHPKTSASSGLGEKFSNRRPGEASPEMGVATNSVAITHSADRAGKNPVMAAENGEREKVPVPFTDTTFTKAGTDQAVTAIQPDTSGKLSLAAVLPAENAMAPMDSQLLATHPIKATHKDKKPSSGTWRIMAGAGIHNHTGNGITLGKSMADNYSGGGLSNNAGGGQGTAVPQIEPTDPGWGLMLGIERSQPFGKSRHWSWVGGFNYQYQTYGISTGAVKDSSLSYSTGRGNVSTANYYRAGNTEKQTGSQHRMHLLAAIQWHLDKNQRWTWQNGFYGGMVLSSDYLIPQNAPLGWVPSKGLTRSGYTGLETGFIFRPSRLGVGVFGQYNLSNSLVISGPAPQYWHGFELRIQYRISSTSSKK